MNIKQIQTLLHDLNKKGYIKTHRKGPTGIGHTLEQELNLVENNISIPDLGGTVELKATRKNSNTLITLFTFNRAAWKVKQKEVIERFGYYDKAIGRQALYNLVYVDKVNSQGLTIRLNESEHTINLFHNETNELLATWSIYTIVGKFLNKLGRLLFVVADCDTIDLYECFNYTSAVLLSNPTPEKFLEAFKKGIVCIDLRMHLKESGAVRNHGTGFRVIEAELPNLYNNKKQIL
jgi:hypothetical protein